MILLTCALYTYFQKTSWLIVIELASTYTFSNYHWFDDVDKLFFRINLMNKNAFYRYRVYIPPPVQLYNSNVPTQRSHIAILIIVPIPARMYASRIVLLAPLARHTLDVHVCACICIYPRMSFGLPHSLENSRHGRERERERERERAEKVASSHSAAAHSEKRNPFSMQARDNTRPDALSMDSIYRRRLHLCVHANRNARATVYFSISPKGSNRRRTVAVACVCVCVCVCVCEC